LNRFDVDLEAAVGRIVHTELDASIERHGVVVVSGSTSVDAQINTRLDRLREVLGE
jgi:flagellar biosynthesis/type III secretory pathway protein FliH